MDEIDLQRKIRKSKSMLSSMGYGIIIFILWSIFKTILYIFVLGETISPGVYDWQDTVFLATIISSAIITDTIAIISGVMLIKIFSKDSKPKTVLTVFLIINFIISFSTSILDLCTIIMMKNFEITILSMLLLEVVYTIITFVALILYIKFNKYCRYVEKNKNEC